MHSLEKDRGCNLKHLFSLAKTHRRSLLVLCCFMPSNLFWRNKTHKKHQLNPIEVVSIRTVWALRRTRLPTLAQTRALRMVPHSSWPPFGKSWSQEMPDATDWYFSWCFFFAFLPFSFSFSFRLSGSSLTKIGKDINLTVSHIFLWRSVVVVIFFFWKPIFVAARKEKIKTNTSWSGKITYQGFALVSAKHFIFGNHPFTTHTRSVSNSPVRFQPFRRRSTLTSKRCTSLPSLSLFLPSSLSLSVWLAMS